MIAFISKDKIKKDFGKRIIVTSALPYVNGIKHLGNLIGSLLPADIYHRFLNLLGVKNIYICGTDDHGTAVELSAKREKMTPKEYTEKYHKIQKAIYEKWGIDFTHFGKTSTQMHKKITQEIFLACYENGYIIEKNIKLPYCLNCKRYLPDRFVVGICPKCGYENARGDQCEKCSAVLDPIDLKNPKCNICKKSDIEFRNETHLFFDFTKAQPLLKQWLLKNKHWPSAVRKSALGWINEGLKPRCITRNLEWGINVPLEKYKHLVFYVWFDAPIGYISISTILPDWKKWWTNSRVYHFLGKDNVPFHTIFWPATLMASENKTHYVLPYFIAGYEYLNWEGKKFSTSKGVGLFTDEALDVFPVDYWRFYLSRILPETKDSNFDWDDFESKINNELIATFGNLFYRVTAFAEKNGINLKRVKAGKKEKQLMVFAEKKEKEVYEDIKNVRLKSALSHILSIASETNRYFQEKEPWAAKDKDTTVYYSASVLKDICILLWPYIPETCENALQCLGVKNPSWNLLNKPLKNAKNICSRKLFEKIDSGKYKNIEKKKYSMSDLTIRVATIESVEDHPNADKLYLLDVNLGNEKRTLVAGLKGVYKKNELKGRQVLVITNLEPAVIRGVESRGMILACENGTLVVPEKHVEDGSYILKSNEEQISFQNFQKHDIHIDEDNGKQFVVCDSKRLIVDGSDIIPLKKVKKGIKIT